MILRRLITGFLSFIRHYYGGQAAERENVCYWASSSFHFYSIQAPSLLDGAAHILGRFSHLVNPLWNPHRQSQKCALPISQA
jgi:hypothetical protein